MIMIASLPHLPQRRCRDILLPLIDKVSSARTVYPLLGVSTQIGMEATPVTKSCYEMYLNLELETRTAEQSLT